MKTHEDFARQQPLFCTMVAKGRQEIPPCTAGRPHCSACEPIAGTGFSVRRRTPEGQASEDETPRRCGQQAPEGEPPCRGKMLMANLTGKTRERFASPNLPARIARATHGQTKPSACERAPPGRSASWSESNRRGPRGVAAPSDLIPGARSRHQNRSKPTRIIVRMHRPQNTPRRETVQHRPPLVVRLRI